LLTVALIETGEDPTFPRIRPALLVRYSGLVLIAISPTHEGKHSTLRFSKLQNPSDLRPSG
jgi:hypothetical protein